VLDGQPLTINSTVDMSLLKPGKHTLVVQAHDNAGNSKVVEHAFTVHAHPGLVVGAPKATRRTGVTYSVEGSLRPTHHIGTTPVTLVFERRELRTWVLVQKALATIGNDGKYRKTVRLSPGTWRVRAEHSRPDAVSRYLEFTLRQPLVVKRRGLNP
jgi:hypothetical protein